MRPTAIDFSSLRYRSITWGTLARFLILRQRAPCGRRKDVLSRKAAEAPMSKDMGMKAARRQASSMLP